ncbi:kinase-like domain-containing protein, partial [Mycena olivaceomarginata]
IDLWSVGCILAELFLRQPLFPGKTLRTPSQEQLSSITSKSSRKFLRALPLWMPIPLRSIFAVNDCAIDLLEKLLTFEPNKRLSASQAISHRYLDEYVMTPSHNWCSLNNIPQRDPDDEPDCPPPEASYLEFDLDGKTMFLEMYLTY